jgi:hypothetical protein
VPASQQPPGDDPVVDRQVTFALRRLPAEIPVPGHVADRITQALASEAAAQRGTPDVTPASTPPTRPWYRRPVTVLAVAATAGVVGLAGASVMDGITGDDPGTSSDTAASADAGRDDAARERLQSDAAAGDSTEESAIDDGRTLAAEALTASVLADLVLDVWNSAQPDPGTCGEPLAAEVGTTLVGSTEAGANVLVVVESPDAGALQGWLIPACSDLAAAAVDRIEVPKPDR